MINPAEEIVNIWLQDQKLFIINNLVVPKGSRLGSRGQKIGGGRGKEVDFFSTDGSGKYLWIEVSVSPNPRLPGNAEKTRIELLKNVKSKFASEKESWLESNFQVSNISKLFVYSPNLFPKKGDNEKLFCALLEKQDIKPVSFAKVLTDVFSNLNYFGYDSPRQYIFLLKKMGYKNE